MQPAKILALSDRVMKFSFFALFALIPVVFFSGTSELFELNKMFLAYVLTIAIAISWIVKIIVTRKVYVQKTPLDPFLAAFLASQIIATILSFDSYVSIWGYYSRFNGGLLSTLCYIFLYYAFLSNFTSNALSMVGKILKISIFTGIFVALWGLPSHFGFDPTCLVFRGTFDVTCWTSDFQPKIRIFSTLGQPAWLGAYLATLLPLSLGYFLLQKLNTTRSKLNALFFLLTAALFYIDILFTKSRAAFIAVWFAMVVMTAFYNLSFLKKVFETRTIPKLNFKKISLKAKLLALVLLALLGITFTTGLPFEQLKFLNLPETQKTEETAFHGGALGGTDSGKIRLLVWRGALEAFKNYPLFGTGVETFAFAYYKYKPVEHNLTSEWNFLYNKAHNEYLNYLATTGIVGFATYLGLILFFLFKTFKILEKKLDLSQKILILALVSGFVSILVSNFFGFSVVIINLYFFLIPAFVFVLAGNLKQKSGFEYSFGTSPVGLKKLQKVGVVFITALGLYLIFFFVKFWVADTHYALGSNLQRAGEYQSAYPYLRSAVEKIDFEPTFRDDYSVNLATLAVMATQSDATGAAELAEELAKESVLNAEVLTIKHPNNVVYWKTKVRVFYTLSQVDDRYLEEALKAVIQAQKLAPNDANISYNLGLLYGQSGEIDLAIKTLVQTVKLKPDYTNAYYALGLYYHQAAINENGVVIDFELQERAIEQMKFILEKLSPDNEQAKEALETWQRELPSPSK